MKKALFSEIPHLRGGGIELKKLLPADAPALAELTGSPRVYRYLPTFESADQKATGISPVAFSIQNIRSRPQAGCRRQRSSRAHG